MEILAFALIFIRVSAFVVAWPVFSSTTVPAPVKILTAFVISLLLLPVVGWKNLDADLMSNQIVWLALKEGFVGALLGYFCRMFFFAISIAGEIISVSMGLSGAQLLNPALGQQGSAMEQFETALATLFFLAINGHHFFLIGLAESFTLLPISNLFIKAQVFSQFGGLVQEIVVIGIKISAPVLIAVLFTNVAMGIVGRAVPQINVLITSLPVNILVGFVVLIVSVPLFIGEMGDLIDVMADRLFWLMKAI